MATFNSKNRTCQPDADEVRAWKQADNSKGIAPPSETAKSLMNREGYDADAGAPQEEGDVSRPQQ